MISAEQYYQERKNNFEEKLKSLRKWIGWVSFLRLVTMVLFVFLLVRGVKTEIPAWYISSGLSLSAFFILVNYHRNLTLRRSKAQALSDLNTNELEALKDDFSAFADGAEFLDIHHEFTYDLDIFGPRSLFQFLNRTCTLEGKKRLAHDLLNSPFQREQILLRQEMYRELAGKPDLMQDFRSEGMLAEDQPEDKQQIMDWLNNDRFRLSVLLKSLMYLIPVLFILILSLGWIFPVLFDYLLIMILFSFAVNGLVITRVNHYHEKISKKHEILVKYLELNKIIAGADFSQPELKSLSGNSRQSMARFGRLDKLMNYLDTRLNIIVGSVLNLLFMFDLHIIRRLERWRVSNKTVLDSFFMVPAQVDSAISFSTFHFNHPGYCWPEIQKNGLEARELGHPLIPSGTRVVNDFVQESGGQIFIITGANMAGKSTFLRTLGVNMILAGAGAPVCSTTFRFEPLRVITGMRTTDSLAESESYFFAELKRLKQIVELLGHGDKILILLDEILKGTNSTDKYSGSVSLIKKFTEKNCLALIATHDLDLGNLSGKFPGSVVNLHFESYIHGNELRFDYRLKEGIAQNMNASFLMQKMGIIE